MTEKSVDQEKKSPESLIINAPEYIAVGQDFFDQEPFKHLSVKAASRINCELSVIFKTLTHLIFYHTWLKPGSKDHMAWWVQRGDLPHLVTKQIKVKDRRKFKQSVSEIIQGLEDFPFWEKYVAAQYDVGLYTGGNWNPKGAARTNPEKQLPLSYANWVTRKLKAEKNSVLLGLEEIFPQDLGETAKPLRPEKGRGYRRWVILKASELLPAR